MKKEKIQIVLISQFKDRIEFATKNLKKLDNTLKVLVADDITSSLQFLDKKDTFTLVVIMAGYSYFEAFEDDYINKFIKVNNCEDFSLKILIIQPLITEGLNKLNKNTVEYIQKIFYQFKNSSVLDLFDSNYDRNLDITNPS